MFRDSRVAVALLGLLALGFVRSASAQWAVIDVGAIAQLIEQYMTLQEQLTTLRDHLEQARREYEALTGERGMERLLAGTVRNYLPPDYRALMDAVAGAGTAYGAFASSAHAFLEANAVLTDDELARLAPAERKHVVGMRRSTATLQALTEQALVTTSGRFESLQQLIDAIPRAEDPKAIMDLQARIQAEQNMLANDNSKLQVLFQAITAEDGAQHQRRREQAIADVGSLNELEPLEFPLPENF
jgi:type IV secretion system protein VirB5